MWMEVVCGVVTFRLLKRYFYDSADVDVADSDLLRHADSFSTRAAVLFSVADCLGGQAFVGLHIPDPDSASRRNIDILLLTQRGAVVVSVVDLPGTVSVDSNDGSWTCTPAPSSGHPKDQRIPDPIAEIKQQVAILESYLEQRGIHLPQGYISYKIICPNSHFRLSDPYSLPPEVITYDQWVQLQQHQSLQTKLTPILRTVPTWDRLELKGNKIVFGEFLEFKGEPDDMQALLKVRRSKVGQLVIQKTSIFDIGRVQVVYFARDYRGEGTPSSESKEVMVRSKTEVVFQPKDATKNYKCTLSSVTSMTLSA